MSKIDSAETEALLEVAHPLGHEGNGDDDDDDDDDDEDDEDDDELEKPGEADRPVEDEPEKKIA